MGVNHGIVSWEIVGGDIKRWKEIDWTDGDIPMPISILVMRKHCIQKCVHGYSKLVRAG